MKLEKGIYKGKLVKSGVAVLDNAKKTEYLYMIFDIDTMIDGGSEIPLGERFTREVKFWLSEKAIDDTEKKLLRLGFDGNYNDPMFMESLYNGINLECGERTAEDGKVFEQWDIYGLRTTKEKQPATKDTIRRLNARWKMNNKPAFSESPATKQSTAVAEFDPDKPDDIPF